MHFTVKREGAAVIVTLPIELNTQNRQTMVHECRDAIDDGARLVVVDCVDCAYIDSAGLGALVSVSKKLQQAGGEGVVLTRLPEDLKVLVELTKLDTLFQICDRSPDEYLAVAAAWLSDARVDGRSAR